MVRIESFGGSLSDSPSTKILFWRVYLKGANEHRNFIMGQMDDVILEVVCIERVVERQ